MGKYHPWYTQDKLEEVIQFFYDWGLSEEGEGTVDCKVAEEYIKRFFSHKNMGHDYHLSVFATPKMLDVLRAEIEGNGMSSWREII